MPRFLEAVTAAIALVLLAPLLLVIAAAVASTSKGGVLFRQSRVGRHGATFTLYKFRSMRAASVGPAITAGGDARVTALGAVLRRTKLDELPELWNVVRGDMSLVGPRPEVPEYVEAEDPLWQRVLAERPGLTHPVTLRLRNEEELLAAVDEDDRRRFYEETLVPFKLRGYVEYAERRTAWSDLAVIWQTVLAIVSGSAPAPTREEIERARPIPRG